MIAGIILKEKPALRSGFLRLGEIWEELELYQVLISILQGEISLDEIAWSTSAHPVNL